MANSYVEIPVTGVDSYAFPFPYIEQSHIKVYAGGVLQTQGVHYTFTDSNTIEFSVGNVPTDTTTSILIQRVTDGTGRLVTYSNTGLDADDLNLGSNQNFYLAQEAVDAAALNITKGVDGVTSVDGRLTNVEDPIDAQDAATKAYVASQLTQSATGGVYTQATEPTSANIGDLWVNSDTQVMSVYTSLGWTTGSTVEGQTYHFTSTNTSAFGPLFTIATIAYGLQNISDIDQVFLNGVLLKECTVAIDFTTGDWDRSLGIIALENNLTVGDDLTVVTSNRLSTDLADAVVNVNSNLATILQLATAGSVNGITLKEQFTATAGQQVFNLTNSYIQGQNNISVYVNGVLQSAYGETSTTSVTLTNPASLGDEVVFIINEHSVTNTVTDSDNVTYTPAGTGAVSTTVQEKLRETVSVKDFGAVGDGVTDDYAACQAALDTGANEVIFPNRHYISQALTSTTDGQTISGVNWNVVGDGASAIVTDQDIEHIISTGNNCIIRYLGFDNTHPNMSKRHIHFSGGSFGVAQFVRLRARENFSALGGGILMDDGAGGIGGVAGSILNCNINHGTIEVKRSDVHISNSWIWANSRPSGIKAFGAVGNLKIDNCDVLPPQTLVADRKAAIHLSGPLTIPVLTNVNFDGNYTLSTGTGLLAENGIIGLSVVGGNSFGHNEDSMILDSLINPSVNGVSFYNNNISGVAGVADIALQDTFAQNLEKPNITNNSFLQTAAVSGTAGPAVVLRSGTTRNGVKITQNSIHQQGTGGGYSDPEILLDDGYFASVQEGSLSGNTGTLSKYGLTDTEAVSVNATFAVMTFPFPMAYEPRIDQYTVNSEGGGSTPVSWRISKTGARNTIGFGFTGVQPAVTLHVNVTL